MGSLEDKINKIKQNKECRAILAFGSDNFRYFTGACLPFADNYPERYAVAVILEKGESFVVSPKEWSEAIKDQGWKGEVIAYDENERPFPNAFVGTLNEELRKRGLTGKIGYDSSKVAVNIIRSLKEENTNINLIPIDHEISEARIVKSRDEVDLIEKASLITERGIIHALNHLEGTLENVGYTIPEFSERIRVHIFESGNSGVGMLCTTFASDTQFMYAPQRGRFRSGELFRIDVSSHLKGYWTSISRMCFSGYVTEEYGSAYNDNLMIKNFAERLLMPEAKCDEIYQKIIEEAEGKGVECLRPVLGHGVGVSHYEPPFIAKGSSYVLKTGMTLALDIATYGPRKEIIRSKDVYEVGNNGCRKLSWYKDWNRIYEVVGFRAMH